MAEREREREGKEPRRKWRGLILGVPRNDFVGWVACGVVSVEERGGGGAKLRA